MGAGVASQIAEREPERVAGMALLGFIYKNASIPAEVIAQAVAEAYGGYSYVREAEWAATTLATAAPEVIAWHQAQFGAAFAFPIGVFLGAGQASVRTPERVTARVLIVTGDRDPLANLPDIEAYLRDVGAAHSRHLYQREVGHLPYVDRPCGRGAAGDRRVDREVLRGCAIVPGDSSPRASGCGWAGLRLQDPLRRVPMVGITPAAAG